MDGNFFRVFARLHPKGQFPYVSLITLGIAASIFSLGNLSEVVGFFLLRFKSPQLQRPFRMWFYPVPGIISLFGWLYVLGTAARKSLFFALAVFVVGSAAYFIRSRKRGEWPFNQKVVG